VRVYNCPLSGAAITPLYQRGCGDSNVNPDRDAHCNFDREANCNRDRSCLVDAQPVQWDHCQCWRSYVSAGGHMGTLVRPASWVTAGILGRDAAGVGDSAHDGRGGYIQFPINLPASFTFYFWSNATSYGGTGWQFRFQHGSRR
jgi:hypothetical protein